MDLTSNIRFAKLSDAEPILKIYEPYIQSTAVTFETIVPRLDTFCMRMENIMETYPWLVYELEGKVVGYAYASLHRVRAAYNWVVEVSVYLDQAFTGQGIGSALYSCLFDVLRSLGFQRALGGIAIPNPASEKLHEKLGFEKVSHYPKVGFKNGEWHDVVWYQLNLADTDHPAQPIKFKDFLQQKISATPMAAIAPPIVKMVEELDFYLSGL